MKEAYGKEYMYQAINIFEDVQKEPWFTKLNPDGHMDGAYGHFRVHGPSSGGSIAHLRHRHGQKPKEIVVKCASPPHTHSVWDRPFSLFDPGLGSSWYEAKLGRAARETPELSTALLGSCTLPAICYCSTQTLYEAMLVYLQRTRFALIGPPNKVHEKLEAFLSQFPHNQSFSAIRELEYAKTFDGYNVTSAILDYPSLRRVTLHCDQEYMIDPDGFVNYPPLHTRHCFVSIDCVCFIYRSSSSP